MAFGNIFYIIGTILSIILVACNIFVLKIFYYYTNNMLQKNILFIHSVKYMQRHSLDVYLENIKDVKFSV